jgi:hypothetical protein
LNGSRRKGRRPNGVAGPFNINIKRRDRACAISATSWFAGGEEADETAIVVAGKDKNGHGYVLAEVSGRYPPICDVALRRADSARRQSTPVWLKAMLM